MEISGRVAAGFALVIIVIGVLFAVQFSAEEWLTLNPPEDMTPAVDTEHLQVFEKSDFNYISQKYRPYKEPLQIATGDELKDSTWYLLFADLNVTPPYGGNPLLGRTGYVQVEYEFENLAGTAAFHVLGPYTDGSWRTNRMEGYGSSALYVTGNSSPGSSMNAALDMEEYNDFYLLPAGVTDDTGDSGISPAYSYYVHFDQSRGGLGSLHFTRDPSSIKGDIYYTGEQSGVFNITHTGGSAAEEVLLLVAVDEMQPDDFSLSADAQFIPTGD